MPQQSNQAQINVTPHSVPLTATRSGNRVTVTGNGTYDFVLISTSTSESAFGTRESSTPPQLLLTYVSPPIDAGAPSFVTEQPGDEIKRDPGRLETFKEYVRNLAHWLGGTRHETRQAGSPGVGAGARRSAELAAG